MKQNCKFATLSTGHCFPVKANLINLLRKTPYSGGKSEKIMSTWNSIRNLSATKKQQKYGLLLIFTIYLSII